MPNLRPLDAQKNTEKKILSERNLNKNRPQLGTASSHEQETDYGYQNRRQNPPRNHENVKIMEFDIIDQSKTNNPNEDYIATDKAKRQLIETDSDQQTHQYGRIGEDEDDERDLTQFTPINRSEAFEYRDGDGLDRRGQQQQYTDRLAKSKKTQELETAKERRSGNDPYHKVKDQFFKEAGEGKFQDREDLYGKYFSGKKGSPRKEMRGDKGLGVGEGLERAGGAADGRVGVDRGSENAKILRFFGAVSPKIP